MLCTRIKVLLWSSIPSLNAMTGFVSYPAVEVINGRYRCLDRHSDSLGSSQNDQNLADVILGRLPSNQPPA